jgi:putative nucleotidyltransferase with HDIG domain
LDDAQNQVRANPPILTVADLDAEQRDRARLAVADIVAAFLQANLRLDLIETDRLREEAAANVAPVTTVYVAGVEIVGEAQTVSQVQWDAIDRLALVRSEPGDALLPVVALGAIAVMLTAFFLWRIAPSQWSQPKHFALLGVLLLLAAAATRLPEVVAMENPEIAYVLPAVMFGYLAAILYDPRTAVLMAVPLAVFTAISTNDPALTIYAGAATIAPVAFVSSVSSRRDLRVAVALSAAVLAPLAGAIAWLFSGSDSAGEAALFAVVGGTVAGLVAQGLLSFLENLFRVTTTITLLDLTDRNHPALRLIEEQAPGTFNHSILVGTLAGKAARAIGADPLLAQAAAFYHDLGKTAEPQYFIENQFGVSNPHDELPPHQSALIIGDHVTEGLKLARQYRLPKEVTDGIRMHHGTGLMRYFFHKALEEDPGVDPAVYRHQGVKPKRKEMAILMISDACEGAARALAQQEDPTADSLRKLVDSIVGEKLEDGQLDESELTFGDLTKVKHAIVQALIGYYHTRIPYPGFPGPRVDR